jgi:hypothetical protein
MNEWMNDVTRIGLLNQIEWAKDVYNIKKCKIFLFSFYSTS